MAASRTSKSIGRAAAPGLPSQDASLLDSLRITPQEHSLLQDLLATRQLQSTGSRALDVVQSKPNNTTGHVYYHERNWSNYYSNSKQNGQRPQETPQAQAHALGVLAEIADIERAWESWHNY